MGIKWLVISDQGTGSVAFGGSDGVFGRDGDGAAGGAGDVGVFALVGDGGAVGEEEGEECDGDFHGDSVLVVVVRMGFQRRC